MKSTDIIDRMGGVSALSELCGTSRAAVSLWRTDGIPPTRWATVVQHAKAQGIDGITWDVVQDARRASQATGKAPA